MTWLVSHLVYTLRLYCRYVKDADKAIVQHLKAAGQLVHVATINHSYPFCWRSETPLIYKVRCWPSPCVPVQLEHFFPISATLCYPLTCHRS